MISKPTTRSDDWLTFFCKNQQLLFGIGGSVKHIVQIQSQNFKMLLLSEPYGVTINVRYLCGSCPLGFEDIDILLKHESSEHHDRDKVPLSDLSPICKSITSFRLYCRSHSSTHNRQSKGTYSPSSQSQTAWVRRSTRCTNPTQLDFLSVTGEYES